MERQILDGIVVLNELIDEVKKNKQKIILFKVDLAKAYDAIDWDYLDEMMFGLNCCTTKRKWM